MKTITIKKLRALAADWAGSLGQRAYIEEFLNHVSDQIDDDTPQTEKRRAHVFRLRQSDGRLVWAVYDKRRDKRLHGKPSWSEKRTIAEAEKRLKTKYTHKVRYKGVCGIAEMVMTIIDIPPDTFE